MKNFFAVLALAFALGLSGAESQTPAPVAPAAPAQSQTPLQQLQAIRAANAKLIDQQTKALQQLAEMEKEAQQIKILAKRS